MTMNNIIEWLNNETRLLREANHVSGYLMIKPRSYREVLQDIVRKRILQRGKKHTSGWES